MYSQDMQEGLSSRLLLEKILVLWTQKTTGNELLGFPERNQENFFHAVNPN
jgi:hypothetical protein